MLSGLLLNRRLLMVLATLACVSCSSQPNTEKLEQIAFSIDNYRDTFGERTPILVTNADGKPLHSWRVLILPFIDANNFWDQYDEASAWNAPANADLADGSRHLPGDKFPYPADVGDFYQSDSSPDSQETRFVALVSGPLEAKPFRNELIAYYVPADQPLVILEVESSDIHWMAPRDLAVAGSDQPDWDALETVKSKMISSIEINAAGTTIRNREETALFLESFSGLRPFDNNPS